MPPISPPPNEKPAETTTKLTRRNRAPDARSQRTGWRTGGGRRSYGRDSSPSRLLCRPWGWGLSEDSRIFVGSSEGQGRDRSERAGGRNNTKRGGGDRERGRIFCEEPSTEKTVCYRCSANKAHGLCFGPDGCICRAHLEGLTFAS